MSPFDPIAAVITGLGRAAVAVIRVSGPGSWAIAAKVFSPWAPDSHRAAYGRFVTGDDGLALPFAEGKSYTGEESVELSVHGSPVSVRLLLEALIANGARTAEPGEFTLRAFMNGRLDLNQAESVRELVDSETELAFRAATAQRTGEASAQAALIRDEVFKIIAAIEASVDFGEEVGEFEPAPGQFSCLLDSLDGLLRDARRSQVLRQGLRVALVGRPNAGKSSLLNALLGSSRAIVTEIPGTTRDFIEEKVDLDGLPVVLIDTAGLRETTDPVELAGIARTREIAAGADEIWFLYDASLGWTSEDAVEFGRLGSGLGLLPSPHPTDENSAEPEGLDSGSGFLPSPPAPSPRWGEGVLILANKVDLIPGGPSPPASPLMRVSSSTGGGLAELIADLKSRHDLTEPPTFIATERHLHALAEAREAIGMVANDADAPYDVMVSALRVAAQALGEITGETASEDMIDRIFSDFCIGK